MEFTFLSAGKGHFYLVLDRMAKLADRYHWTIRQLYVDPAGEEWGGRTEIVAEIWNITIIAQPPHVWQEHTHQENGVKQVTQTARYYMQQAPWMGSYFWGAALLYATYTRWFLERKSLGGYNPWFAAFKRIPHIKASKLCPWGAPVQVGRWKPQGKETERSYDG